MSRLERRWILALAVLLGLNLAAYLAFTLPRSMQRRNLAARLQVLKSEIELERDRTAGTREASQAVEANAKDSQRFLKEKIGERRPGLLSVLRSIEEMASAQGLKVGSQGYSDVEVKNLPLQRLQITMPVEGSYRQLLSFLQGLERFDSQFLTLDQIAVRSGEGGQGHLNLVLSCYFHGSEESRP